MQFWDEMEMQVLGGGEGVLLIVYLACLLLLAGSKTTTVPLNWRDWLLRFMMCEGLYETVISSLWFQGGKAQPLYPLISPYECVNKV